MPVDTFGFDLAPRDVSISNSDYSGPESSEFDTESSLAPCQGTLLDSTLPRGVYRYQIRTTPDPNPSNLIPRAPWHNAWEHFWIRPCPEECIDIKFGPFRIKFLEFDTESSLGQCLRTLLTLTLTRAHAAEECGVAIGYRKFQIWFEVSPPYLP